MTPIPPNDAPLLEVGRDGKFTGRLDWRWRMYLIDRDASIEAQADENAFPDRSAQIQEALEMGLRIHETATPVAERDAERLMPLHARPVDEKDGLLLASVPERSWSRFVLIADTAANQANYPAAAYPEALYLATDTYDWYRSNGGAGWVQIIYPVLLFLGAAAATHGALARSGAGLESRLGDNSAASFMKVLDEVYGAGWDGSTEVPTKNAVYDKIEAVIAAAVALISDAAFGAGWNGVTTIGPSKNAVYDEMITKLTANGVNFGPAAVASITIVDGQVTAVS